MILDDPFDDPAGLPVPDRSPEPTKEQLDVSVFILCQTQYYCTVSWQSYANLEVMFVIILMIKLALQVSYEFPIQLNFSHKVLI